MSTRGLRISGKSGSNSFEKSLITLTNDYHQNSSVEELTFWSVRFDDIETTERILNVLFANPNKAIRQYQFKRIIFNECTFSSDDDFRIIDKLFESGTVSSLSILNGLTFNDHDDDDDDDDDDATKQTPKEFLNLLSHISLGLQQNNGGNKDTDNDDGKLPLEYLSLRGPMLDENATKLLGYGLASSTTIKTLDISYNTFTSFDAIETLANGLHDNMSLQKISINHCRLSDKSLATLISHGLVKQQQQQLTTGNIKIPSTIRSINFEGNLLGYRTINALTLLLSSSSCQLESLDIRQGADELRAAIAAGATMTERFGHAVGVVGALVGNNMNNNNENNNDNNAAAAVAVANHNNNVTGAPPSPGGDDDDDDDGTVSTYNQRMENALRNLIREGLATNTSLRTLKLCHRPLSDNVMSDLAYVFGGGRRREPRRGRGRKERQNDGTDTQDEEKKTMVRKINSTIRFLDMMHCRISDVGLLTFSKSLGTMRGLQKLWIGGYQDFHRSSVRTLILSGLRDNVELLDIIIPRKEQSYFYKRYAYYTTLNNAGRRLLCCDNDGDDGDEEEDGNEVENKKQQRRRRPVAVPISIWPLVFSRANKFIKFTSQDKTRIYTSKEDILYYFLCNNPSIING